MFRVEGLGFRVSGHTIGGGSWANHDFSMSVRIRNRILSRFQAVQEGVLHYPPFLGTIKIIGRSILGPTTAPVLIR